MDSPSYPRAINKLPGRHDASTDSFWVENEAYDSEAFEILYIYFRRQGQQPLFKLTCRDDIWGYVVTGTTDTGQIYGFARGEEQASVLAENEKRMNVRRGGTRSTASSRMCQQMRGSWRSTWSDRLVHLRPHSQFSQSSDAVKARLAGSLASWMRTSDASNLSWYQPMQLVGWRWSKASDEMKLRISTPMLLQQSCVIGEEVDLVDLDERRASRPASPLVKRDPRHSAEAVSLVV